MQGATLLVGQVVALIVRDQVDDRSIGQGCGLIENETPPSRRVLGVGSCGYSMGFGAAQQGWPIVRLAPGRSDQPGSSDAVSVLKEAQATMLS